MPNQSSDDHVAAQNRDGSDETFLIGEEKITAPEDDEFGHTAHVDTLERIVSEVTPPWHIALYGTWGAGKSSIVRLLYERIRRRQEAEADTSSTETATDSDPLDHTLCVSFNAWKHAEESLRTELLLDLNQELRDQLDARFDGDNDNTVRQDDGSPQSDAATDESSDRLALYDREKGVMPSDRLITELYDVEDVTDERTRSAVETITNLGPWTVGTILILFFVGSYFVMDGLGTNLPGNNRTVLAIGVFLEVFVSIGGANAVIGNLLGEVREARQEVDHKLSNPQNEWSGAYENLFNAIVESAEAEYQDRHPADEELERILITVDDVDRCQSQSALEILIAIKSFLSHEKCIYIVPCDEDALYDHLEAADDGDYLSDAVNQQNFLAKFFETELEIPTPSDSELEAYFDLRKDQYDHTFDSRSMDVLKQADLETPRRITRALNRLTVLEELGENREVVDIDSMAQSSGGDKSSAAVEATSSDGGPIASDDVNWNPQRAFLAVVSILQTDYARLHAALERDPELLNELYERVEGGFATGERQGLDPLFDSLRIPEERRDPLVAFLNETRDVAQRIETPAAFLRLTETPASDEDIFQTRFDRNRVAAARTIIENRRDVIERDAPDNAVTEAERTLDMVTEYMVRKISEEASQVDAIPTAVGIADALGPKRRQEVGEALLNAIREERPEELLGEMELSAFIPVLERLDPPQRREFLTLYIESIVDENGVRDESFESLIEGPGELLANIEVQEAFAETINTARRRRYIDDAAFAAILSDIRERQPDLYTPALIKGK